ncbi:MAG: alpha/beta fold hydrolase [Calditrichia bacterium]
MTRFKILLLIYAFLLTTSFIYQWIYPFDTTPTNHQTSVPIAGSGEPVIVNTLDLKASDTTDAPVILLLHGSPVAVEMFDDLLPELRRYCRVIAPDLPGYGTSSREISDYSVAAHAVYMQQLLDSLQIQTLHVVGYSQGGGVAIYLSEMLGERIKSLTLLSAIGVVELELLGDYHLNHAIHGAQLAGFWLLHYGFPHFGFMKRFPLNIYYARNFYDTDQRPLRALLKKLEIPLLIQHGNKDALVPYPAALEHHRIVPQSELITYKGGHGILSGKGPQMAQDLSEFIYRVESGTALSRSQADLHRVQKADVPFVGIESGPAEGLVLFVLILVIAFGTLISEDLACIAAGILAARGMLSFPSAVFASFIGIFIGDILLFLAGKWLGRPALKKAPLKWIIKSESVEKSTRWFQASGPQIILASRFLPGTRLATYFGAGMLGASMRTFVLYFGLAALIWTPLLVGMAMLLGNPLIEIFTAYSAHILWLLLGGLILLHLLTRTLPKLFTWKGRRLVYSSWKRFTNWEFWPPYFFYPPLIVYLIYLGIRHRSFTLFTAVNPAMPASGFVGESKSDILAGLSENNDCIADFKLIEDGLKRAEKLRAITEFQSGLSPIWPVVLKPDTGERGSGVTIAKNMLELERFIDQTKVNFIVQKYVSGVEFGVFYYRYPNEKSGQIFSITDKQFITVRGNGKNTLEELILLDERAVCMAAFHLDKHAQLLYEVPSAGEEIPLVELGTHSKGALFLDGSRINTPALLKKIDENSQGYEGFYFGRYDIRAETEEDFRNGINLKIIELNGVTSEATHIYDPKNSVFDAYRILAEQWRIAFEIGRQNKERGEKPVGLISLLKLIITSRTT